MSVSVLLTYIQLMLLLIALTAVLSNDNTENFAQQANAFDLSTDNTALLL